MGALNLGYSDSPKFKVVAKLLDGSKLPVSEIARMSGVSDRTVYRWAAGAGGPMYLKERCAKLAINKLNELSEEDKELIKNNLLPEDALDDAVTIVDCRCDDLESAQAQETETVEVNRLPAPGTEQTDELSRGLLVINFEMIAKCFDLMERHYQSRKQLLSSKDLRSVLPGVSEHYAHATTIAFKALYGVKPLSPETDDALVYMCRHFDLTGSLPRRSDCKKKTKISSSQLSRACAAFCFLKRRDPAWKYESHQPSMLDLKPKNLPAVPKTAPSSDADPMLTLRAGGLELCVEQASLPAVIRVLKEEGVI